MNLTDPSLYGVTYPQREIGPTFMGPVPWQNVPRFVPPIYPWGMQAVHPYGPYGMQPYGMPPCGMQPFGMQPLFYPAEKLGTQQLPLYGTQPFYPQTFGYTTPFQAGPYPAAFNPFAGGGICNTPFNTSMMPGWQRPIWY